MKVTVEATRVIEFPALMVSTIGGRTIVLFTSENTGVVINTSADYPVLGYYSYEWNIETFEKFQGTVSISNG